MVTLLGLAPNSTTGQRTKYKSSTRLCRKQKMSGGLAPSKSTVYVSNLPYELTNSDLHQIFDKYGKVAKVTIVKDKETRESKGVAFVLFVERTAAHRAITALNRKELFGRTIKCSVAKDNGRASEFIRRKTYRDKTRCYECGEFGHLSFRCPKNMLGDRAQPEKKKKKRKKSSTDSEPSHSSATAMEPESDREEEDDWSLEQAIRHCQYMREREESQSHSRSTESHSHTGEMGRRQLKPDSYFSDEDASD